MDTETPWNDDPTNNSHREAEWTKLSTDFTNAGYRDGITVGKEASLQEGFNTGFASIGVPVGRELGRLRGTASALVSILSSPHVNELAPEVKDPIVKEVRNIALCLSQIHFSDVAPRDLEAEEHAKQHLQEEVMLDGEISRRRDLEKIEDMLRNITISGSVGTMPERLTADDVKNLKARLSLLSQRLGLQIDLS